MIASEDFIIGIDIGTGSTKAVAMNIKGIIIANSQMFYATKEPRPGYSEQDPDVIWNAFVSCIKKIVLQLGKPPVSVSISSAMHSLLLMDKQHIAITPLITWADTRSGSIAQEIRQLPNACDLYQTTGTPIHSMIPLCKIMWFKKNQPEIFHAAAKFISIKEYVWYKLFGVYEIDHSIASATGLFNIHSLEWCSEALSLCGIESSQLSKIVPTNFLRKNAGQSLPDLFAISSDTSFCIGASDGCLANLGSFAIEKGTAALTIGTSGAVRIASPKPIFDFDSMSFNYLLDENTFICGGPVNNGGNVVDWLFDAILNNEHPSEKDFKSLFEAIDTIPAGSKGLIFLPYVFGERAPVWDEKSSGCYFGIRSIHTNACFLRATIEGICFSLRQVLQILESFTGKIDQMNISGGFIHSKTWGQILADITGKKLCVVETEDSSSIGAALLNMKALKWIDNYDTLKPRDEVTIYSNADAHAVYEKYYSVFKNLYPQMKDLMHRAQQIASDG